MHIGTQLERQVEEEIMKVVLKTSDLFAWSTADMPGVDPSIICHKLALCSDAKYVSQKKRKMGEERIRVVEEETKRLVEAGFIREIKYSTWLANVMLVKKSSGKWQMCTDYRDLSKASQRIPICYRVLINW